MPMSNDGGKDPNFNSHILHVIFVDGTLTGMQIRQNTIKLYKEVISHFTLPIVDCRIHTVKNRGMSCGN